MSLKEEAIVAFEILFYFPRRTLGEPLRNRGLVRVEEIKEEVSSTLEVYVC